MMHKKTGFLVIFIAQPISLQQKNESELLMKGEENHRKKRKKEEYSQWKIDV